MPCPETMGTLQQTTFAMLFHHRSRNDPRRDCNDRITYQHHASRDKTSDRGNRRYISITDRCHGNYRPINTIGYIIELGIRLRTLDHEHDRSDRSNQDKDKKEKHKDLPTTQPQRHQQQIPLFQEIKQLEHTKHPDQTESSYN